MQQRNNPADIRNLNVPLLIWEAKWTTVEGVEVLRVAGSKFVGVPCTGRRNAARFDVLDLDAGELLCQLTSKEIHGWLSLRARDDEELPATGTYIK